MSTFSEILRSSRAKENGKAAELILNYNRKCIDTCKKPPLNFMVICLEAWLAKANYEDALGIIDQIEDYWSKDLIDETKISETKKIEKIILKKIICLTHLGQHKKALETLKEVENNVLLKKEDILKLANLFLAKDVFQESEYCFELFFKIDALHFEAVCGYTDFLYKSKRKREVVSFVIDKFLLFRSTIEAVDYICAVCGYLFNGNHDDEVLHIYEFLSDQMNLPEKSELFSKNYKTQLDLLMIGFEASFYTDNHDKVINIGNEVHEKYASNNSNCVDPKFYCIMAESHYKVRSIFNKSAKEVCLDYLNKALRGYKNISASNASLDIEIYCKIQQIEKVISALDDGLDVDWEEAELYL